MIRVSVNRINVAQILYPQDLAPSRRGPSIIWWMNSWFAKCILTSMDFSLHFPEDRGRGGSPVLLSEAVRFRLTSVWYCPMWQPGWWEALHPSEVIRTDRSYVLTRPMGCPIGIFWLACECHTSDTLASHWISRYIFDGLNLKIKNAKKEIVSSIHL
jgi:hypothetical protein